jgi:hypothetical protein
MLWMHFARVRTARLRALKPPALRGDIYLRLLYSVIVLLRKALAGFLFKMLRPVHILTRNGSIVGGCRYRGNPSVTPRHGDF